MLERAIFSSYCLQSPPQDHQISHERPVLHVVEVQPHGVLPGEVRPAADLPEAGDAGLHEEAAPDPVLVLCRLPVQRRAGTDQGHAAGEHIEELRQLIEAESAEEPPEPGHAGVVAHLEEDGVPGIAVASLELVETALGIGDHRTELQHLERLSVQAESGLLEQHATGARQLHRHGEAEEHRRE